MQKLLILTIILTIFLLTLGIITSAFGACLGCPDWPLCYGSILPPETITAKLEYYHRIFAALVGVLSFLVAIGYYKKHRKLSILLIILITSQILVGGLTVLLKMPFIISISHAILGILTYITLILLLKGNFKFEKKFWTLAFILVFIYYIWGSIVDKTASKLACENLLCISENLNDTKSIIQLIYQIINLSMIFISLISIYKFDLKKLSFLILSILLFILNYLVIKSLLSVSMITIHYLILLFTLSFSLINVTNEAKLKTLKTSEI